MNQPSVSLYSANDFIEWNNSEQLEVTPKFQRGNVWSNKAKSYLIDSMLRSMPIPPIFIRLKIDPIKRKSIREIVDGQQRIQAVIGFVNNDFPVLKTHNPSFGGLFYRDLPNDVKDRLLSYQFQANILSDVGDAAVLEIFSRINTYTVPLNAQELRNASFFGEFKTTVYDITHKYYSFWQNNRIFTDQKIARMSDAELVSILLITMMDGIQQTKAANIKSYYEDYDINFPLAKKTVGWFDEVIEIIGNTFEDTLATSPFRRVPLFFSYFVFIFDAKFGLPESKYPRVSLNQPWLNNLKTRTFALSEALKLSSPLKKYADFLNASSLSTADIGRRKYRHKFLWKELLEQ